MTISITENIQLALTGREHAEQLFGAIDNNRSHLSVFLPWVNNMQTVANVESYLIGCELLYEQKKEVSFVILLDEVAVGRIGLHHWNPPNKTAAIGYWLSHDAEGKGIITLCCKWLIQYGFEQMDLNRIEIKAAVKNRRSQAIPLKFNFTQEGVLRQAEWVNHEFVDLILFSLLKAEWPNPQR